MRPTFKKLTLVGFDRFDGDHFETMRRPLASTPGIGMTLPGGGASCIFIYVCLQKNHKITEGHGAKPRGTGAAEFGNEGIGDHRPDSSLGGVSFLRTATDGRSVVGRVVSLICDPVPRAHVLRMRMRTYAGRRGRRTTPTWRRYSPSRSADSRSGPSLRAR